MWVPIRLQRTAFLNQCQKKVFRIYTFYPDFESGLLDRSYEENMYSDWIFFAFACLSAQIPNQPGMATEIYGTYCGFAGTPPKARKQVERWIEKSDTKALADWLTSVDLAEQVNAAEVFISLKNEGLTLEKELVDKILELKSSERTIFSCMGCVYSKASISDLLRDFSLLH